MPIETKRNRFFMAQAERLLRSFHHWTGRDLLAPADSIGRQAEALFHAPIAVVSHGTEPDPILNYGNGIALALWEMPWEAFTRTPSRLTAEPVGREARAKRLEEVAQAGFIDHYEGIRISSRGRRFRIEETVIWNLLDEENQYCGQAAAFYRWSRL